MPMRYASVDDFWNLHSEIAGPLVGVLRNLDAESLRLVREALPAAMAPFQSEDGYEMPSLTLVVCAA